MLFKSLWKMLLRVDGRVVIVGTRREVAADGQPVLVVSVRLRKRRTRRGLCGVCGRLSPGHDAGAGRRRWRSLDQGTTRCYVEADAPRVACKVHGVTVAEVPWARHGAGFTRDFEDQVAWLAVYSSKKAITELMRIAWRTVGAIVERISDDARARADPLDGLARIGIDEVAYRKGHRYLTLTPAGLQHPATMRVSSGQALETTVTCIPPRHFLSAAQEELFARVLGHASYMEPTTHGAKMVAAGQVDACLQLRGELWDYAALTVIVEQAGGTVTCLDGPRRLDHGGPLLFSNGYLRP